MSPGRSFPLRLLLLRPALGATSALARSRRDAPVPARKAGAGSLSDGGQRDRTTPFVCQEGTDELATVGSDAALGGKRPVEESKIERQYRGSGDLQVLMVSRGDVGANRAKASEHGLTFPVVLQKQWEISREYGMFATPIAYLIDEEGKIARDAAVGVEPILALLASAPDRAGVPAAERRCGCGKSSGRCRCGRNANATAPVTAGGSGSNRRGDRHAPKI